MKVVACLCQVCGMGKMYTDRYTKYNTQLDHVMQGHK